MSAIEPRPVEKKKRRANSPEGPPGSTPDLPARPTVASGVIDASAPSASSLGLTHEEDHHHQMEHAFFQGGLSEDTLSAAADAEHDRVIARRETMRHNAIYGVAVIAVIVVGLGISKSRNRKHTPEPAAVTAAPPTRFATKAQPVPRAPVSPPAKAPVAAPAIPAPAAPIVAAVPAAPIVAAVPAAPIVAAVPAAAPVAVVAPVAAAPVPALSPAVEALHIACRRALGTGRPRDIAGSCDLAFGAGPSADLATQVAQNALEKGRKADAATWAKKALTADPRFADALVFLGGAEQELGHPAEAKAAYQKYLDLAPAGKYAADIKAVLGSM